MSISELKKTPLHSLYPYYLRYRRRIRLGFLCIMGTNLFALAAPYFLKFAVDGLREGASHTLISFYAVLIVVLSIVQGIFRFKMRQYMIGVSRWMENDLRNDLFAHLQKLSLVFYSENRTGDIMSRCTEDLNAVRMFLGPGVMHFFNTAFTFLFNASIMIHISPRLTLLVLLPLPLVSLVVKVFTRKLHYRYKEIHRHIARMSDMLQETFSGIRVIRAYGREKSEMKKFEILNQDNMTKNLQVVRVWGFFFPLMLLTSGLGAVVVLWWGGREVISGTMTLGDFVAFNTYLAMLTFPMMALGWVITLYQKGSVAMGRINEILEREPQITDNPGNHLTRPLDGSIEFKELTFSYGEGPPVLKKINLRIPEGTTLGVVGYVGSGKSTLLSLIPRLYEAPDNQIFIGGQNIRDIPLKTLRSQMGYVPQEPLLYSESLRENIAFGLARASLETIMEATRIAELLSDTEALAERFDTQIGEKGVALSRGQRQRATLARALIVNSPILLLDDIFASVDSYTENKIMTHLKRYISGRTCLIVSHRLCTVQDADWIIVLKDGEIKEEGTHQKLLQLEGIYAKMYRRQTLLHKLSIRPETDGQ